jgi:hypothetical protein
MITNAAGVAGKVVFVVCHVLEMLNALQPAITPLGTASSGVRHEAPAPNGQEANRQRLAAHARRLGR